MVFIVKLEIIKDSFVKIMLFGELDGVIVVDFKIKVEEVVVKNLKKFFLMM